MRAKIKPVQTRPLRSRDTGKAKALRHARNSCNRAEKSESIRSDHSTAPYMRLTATAVCSEIDFFLFDLEQTILLSTPPSEKTNPATQGPRN